MSKPEFLCYGIIDKNGTLLLEPEAFSGLCATVEATVEMLNIPVNTFQDERTPYQPVKIYIEKL